MWKKKGEFVIYIQKVKWAEYTELYHACLDNFFSWLKDKEFSLDSVKDFLHHLKDLWKNQNTRQLYQSVLVSFLARQKKEDKIKQQKHQIQPPKPTKKQTSKKKWWERFEIVSKDEIKKLLQSVNKKHHYLLLALAYGAWLKVGELVWLRVKDIDTTSHQVTIHKKWKQRKAPLPARIIDDMKQYTEDKQWDEYLFPGRGGAKMSPRSVQYMFAKYAKKVEIEKDVSIKALRHSFAVHLLEQWVDIHHVKELMGHSNIRTTQMYKKMVQTPLHNIQSPL
jgi:site-specific recombinase XerD